MPSRTINPHLPQYSLLAWQRYEPIVVEWLKHHPSAYIFAPESHSVETVLARLRNAIDAKLAFNYPSDKVDHETLRAAWANATVTHATVKGYIRIGQREKGEVVIQGEIKPDELDQKMIQTQSMITVQSNAELKAAMLLVSRSILTCPVRVIDATGEHLKTFQDENHPNLSLVSTDSNGFTFI